MNGFNSLVKTFWIFLVVFVLFGWLVRDRFQLASELESLRAQFATLEDKHAHDTHYYQARVAELEDFLSIAQQAEAQYEQLLTDYNDLQNKALLDAQTLERFQQELSAEQSARARAEAALAQCQAAHETLRQNAGNDLQTCLNTVTELEEQQSNCQPALPEVQEPINTNAGIAVMAGLLVSTGLLGAVRVVYNTSSRSSRRTASSQTNSPSRQVEGGLQPLILRQINTSRPASRERADNSR